MGTSINYFRIHPQISRKTINRATLMNGWEVRMEPQKDNDLLFVCFLVQSLA